CLILLRGLPGVRETTDLWNRGALHVLPGCLHLLEGLSKGRCVHNGLGILLWCVLGNLDRRELENAINWGVQKVPHGPGCAITRIAHDPVMLLLELLNVGLCALDISRVSHRVAIPWRGFLIEDGLQVLHMLASNNGSVKRGGQLVLDLCR